MPPLILASTSSYRQSLLRKLGIPFRSLAPQTDETPLLGENAHQLVMRLAQAKAHSVAQSLDQGWIIGSDQVCVIDDQILGKPGTHERAVEQLQRLSGHAITFYTGLCLWDVASQQRQVIMEPFVVHFRELNDTQINSYLYQERPYDCAGSFKSEALGICLFERFEGRDPNALVGLPLMALTDMFQTWGITLPLECQ
ncbi:MAG: septum formation inhibitor Maf [Aeromonadaceae bacterium]|nr:septum formation inhibitor Maf [Aeromonadaceae bacterium]